jgi:hypothetical protein
MADHSKMRLGKKPARHDKRTLKLSDYLDPNLTAPDTSDWASKMTNIGMMLNDTLGDCVLPDTEISGPGIEKAYRAPYNGPVVDLRTATGKRLSVTPNHGVMTTRGFVRARELRKGDHLVSSGSPQSVASRIDDNFDQAPTLAENLFTSLRSRSVLPPSKMSGSIDFHGDETFFQGQVDVVNVDRLLKSGNHTSLRKPESQFEFLSRSGSPLTLDGDRSFSTRMKSISLTPSNLMGGLRTSTALLRREPVVANESCLLHSSKFHASPAQPTLHGAPTDTHLAAEFCRSFPGLVTSDELIDIGSREWRGHVYDYSTQVHWYSANGIFVHNCTCAGAGHLIQQWTAANGSQVIVSDADIEKAYEAVGGYVPGDESTDNGAVEIDVLKFWQKTGIGGFKIGAFVSVDPKNKLHLKLANALFGGAYFGIGLPVTAQTQEVWAVPDGGLVGDGAPNSWGGHAVPMGAYDLDGLTVITWGQEKKATWDFIAEYCDEAYCILSPQWTDGTKAAPSGFNLAQLQADLAGVQN